MPTWKDNLDFAWPGTSIMFKLIGEIEKFLGGETEKISRKINLIIICFTIVGLISTETRVFGEERNKYV